MSIKKNRALGLYWENQFCCMAEAIGKSYTPMQVGLSHAAKAYNKGNFYTLPDITIWTSPGEYHEIKHKNPFNKFKRFGPVYGLEKYRFESLLWFAEETQQQVMYTIHDHDLAGGKLNPLNRIWHWKTINILELNNKWCHVQEGPTYYSGRTARKEIYYWSIELWKPLSVFWQVFNNVPTPLVKIEPTPILAEKLEKQFEHIDRSSAYWLSILWNNHNNKQKGNPL